MVFYQYTFTVTPLGLFIIEFCSLASSHFPPPDNLVGHDQGESSGDDYSITLVKAELLYRSRVLENTELDPTQNILPSPIGYWDIFWKDRCEEDRPPISR